jgi:hypothetical protein
MRFSFPRVLSNQKESSPGSFDGFFPAQEMSYYGGADLPETEDLGIDLITSGLGTGFSEGCAS